MNRKQALGISVCLVAIGGFAGASYWVHKYDVEPQIVASRINCASDFTILKSEGFALANTTMPADAGRLVSMASIGNFSSIAQEQKQSIIFYSVYNASRSFDAQIAYLGGGPMSESAFWFANFAYVCGYVNP